MDIKERKKPHMKRLIALLLGIVLLLTAVPALADEETDDLNEIARKVEEEYLLPLSEGEGAKTEVLEVCLEMLKDAKGGPKKSRWSCTAGFCWPLKMVSLKMQNIRCMC